MAESLARLSSSESVIGIDPTPQVLQIATEHMRRDPALKGKLRYLNTTIDELEGFMGNHAMAGESDAGKTTLPNKTLFDVVCLSDCGRRRGSRF